MSWWDYGYQITAMANRTILVDNNTWNNTHISRVGQVNWCDITHQARKVMHQDHDALWSMRNMTVCFDSNSCKILTSLNKFCTVLTRTHLSSDSVYMILSIRPLLFVYCVSLWLYNWEGNHGPSES